MADLNKPGTIERAIALADIYATLYRYAANARDTTTWEVKASLFTEDAQIILPNGKALPASNMSELGRGQESEYYRHHITAIDVNFINENKARSITQQIASNNSITCDHWGDWVHTLVRGEDGKWLIEELKLIVNGSHPDGWYTATYGQV